MKKKINLENILCLYVIICPILDMLSFIFRNAFQTSMSPSTIIRPIIAIIVAIVIFLKRPVKKKLIIAGLIYTLYAVGHLLIFQNLQTESAYSNFIHEAQYLVNYTFMILNLFIYLYIFHDKGIEKLKKSLLISVIIYIVSIYISIITKTSSSTYIEGMGYKGWFESGNSIGAILILSLFVLYPMMKEKKYRIATLIAISLTGIFLTVLIGTRVGLFGFFLVSGFFIAVEIVFSFIKNKKLNKKLIAISVVAMGLIIVLIGTVGSVTLERRKHLKQIEGNVVDTNTNEVSHISGDLLKIKNQIDAKAIDSTYMSEASQKSILELYDIANKKQIANNDMRMQQFIFNACLVKNQANIGSLLLGNGYMNQFRELVLEMEIPAFVFNFGLIGFILYFVPFLGTFLYFLYAGVKNWRKIDDVYIMLLAGSGFTFVLSFLSGYVFFSSSTMMVNIVINALLLNKIKNELTIKDSDKLQNVIKEGV